MLISTPNSICFRFFSFLVESRFCCRSRCRRTTNQMSNCFEFCSFVCCASALMTESRTKIKWMHYRKRTQRKMRNENNWILLCTAQATSIDSRAANLRQNVPICNLVISAYDRYIMFHLFLSPESGRMDEQTNERSRNAQFDFYVHSLVTTHNQKKRQKRQKRKQNRQRKQSTLRSAWRDSRKTIHRLLTTDKHSEQINTKAKWREKTIYRREVALWRDGFICA